MDKKPSAFEGSAVSTDAVRRLVDAGLSDDALVELDPHVRGGVDPDAPWPAYRGDLWYTRRSIAEGPAHGRIAERRDLDVRVEHVSWLVVDARGRILTPAVNEKELVWIHGDTIERSGLPSGAPSLLAWGPSSRWGMGDEGGTTVQRPSGDVVAFAGKALVTPGRVFATPPGSIRAVDSATGRVHWSRTVHFLLDSEADVVPGPHVLWWTEGYHELYGSERYNEERIERLDVVTGDSLGGQSGSHLLAAPCGTTVHSYSEAAIEVVPDGSALRRDHPRRDSFQIVASPPFALAGRPDDHVLVTSRSAYSLRDGSPRWRSPSLDLADTKVDVNGVVWARCEGDLVALDPETGKAVHRVSVAKERGPLGKVPAWSFAFAGNARIYVLVDDGERTELVVVE